MKPVLAWVLGRGGLIGSHLVRALAGRLPYAVCWEPPVPRWRWSDAAVLREQLAGAAAAFAGAVRAGQARWLVLWAAGGGVVGSAREALEAETAAWRWLLDLLAGHLLDGPRPVPGLVFLASSAGGVFGQGADGLLTEDSPCGPVSAYGRHKLLQEEILRDWALRRPGAGYLVGRLSNVYGAGQNLAKPQGLISQLARCLIHRRPAYIYVPLDTLRDYIYVEDCADLIGRCLDRALGQGGCRTVKLIASEEAASVAQLVGIFARLSRLHPRIICGPSPQALQQPRRLRFRSVVWPDLRPCPRTSLALGIRRVHEHLLGFFQRGCLSPPPAPRGGLDGLAGGPARPGLAVAG